MHVVLDASVIVTALIELGPAGDATRDALRELSSEQNLHIVQSLTYVECASALRRVEGQGLIPEDLATATLTNLYQLPVRRWEVTLPMLQRAFQLRRNITIYDATYVALAERIQAETGDPEVVIATLDGKLARAPGITVEVRVLA